MKQRTVLILITVSLALVLVSGCIGTVAGFIDSLRGGYCSELEKELEKEGMNANCYPTDFVPDLFNNDTDDDIDPEGRCHCSIEVGNRTVTVQITQIHEAPK